MMDVSNMSIEQIVAYKLGQQQQQQQQRYVEELGGSCFTRTKKVVAASQKKWKKSMRTRLHLWQSNLVPPRGVFKSL
jgi:hypothetical protein